MDLPLLYYERAYAEGNLEVFKPLLIGFYDEEFSEDDEMRNIVLYEKKFTMFLAKLLVDKFSLVIEINAPYFLGFGSTAIVYSAHNTSGNTYAVKFLVYGEGRYFSDELAGYFLIQEHDVVDLFPKLYFSYFEHQNLEIGYYDLDGRNAAINLKAFGLLVEDKTEMSLRSYLEIGELSSRESRVISRNFHEICVRLEENGLVHADLSFTNISINSRTLELKFLDYADVASTENKKARDEFMSRFYDLKDKL